MHMCLLDLVLLLPVEEEVLVICLLLLGCGLVLLELDVLEEVFSAQKHFSEEVTLFLAPVEIPLMHIHHFLCVFLMTKFGVEKILLRGDIPNVIGSKVMHPLVNVVHVSSIVCACQLHLRLWIVALQLRHRLVPKQGVVAACLFCDAIWYNWLTFHFNNDRKLNLVSL